MLDALRAVEDLTTHDDEVYAAIDIIEPLLAQPEPEPVAGYRWEEGRTPPSVTFAAPPQREWQGLTDEEAEQITDAHWNDPAMFIEAIEAKLKEKNASHL